HQDKALRFYAEGLGFAKKADFMVDGVDEAIALDRRKFIKGVGFAVLTAQCLSLIACASGNSASDGDKTADNLIIHSSPGTLSHVHDLLIPYAVSEQAQAAIKKVSDLKSNKVSKHLNLRSKTP